MKRHRLARGVAFCMVRLSGGPSTAAIAVPVLTQFVADQRASSGAANGGGRAAHGATECAASHGADTGADLGVGGIGRAAHQAQGGCAGGGGEKVAVLHGGS